MIQSSTLLIYQKEKFLQPWPMDRLPCYRYEKYHFWSADFNREKQTASRLLKELWPGFTNQRSHVLPGDNSYKECNGSSKRRDEETNEQRTTQRPVKRISDQTERTSQWLSERCNNLPETNFTKYTIDRVSEGKDRRVKVKQYNDLPFVLRRSKQASKWIDRRRVQQATNLSPTEWANESA